MIEENTKIGQKLDQKMGVKEGEKAVLARGVDSLYVYLDQGLPFEILFAQAVDIPFDEDVTINGITFTRTAARMNTYPLSLRYGPFLIFLNRVSAYIQVGSLGFEMRGFQGCIIWLSDMLTQIAAEELPWLELLKVSRIDVFTDFIFDEIFDQNQFKTKLRARGMMESGKEFEGKTYYFGNRALFCIRLYVKSAEIDKKGKGYLRSQWKKQGYQGQRVWRLEFEFRKRKLEQLVNRELVYIDEVILDTLWAYGIDQLSYMKGEASHRNLYKKDMHPLWQNLHDTLFKEYAVRPLEVRHASWDYRWKIAQRALVSFYALDALKFGNIPENIRDKFSLGELEYTRAKRDIAWLEQEL